MSEPSGPQGKSGRGTPPRPEPNARTGTPDANEDLEELDFEPDALLDTLLADPFPIAQQGTPTARPPKPFGFEVDSLHDDVTGRSGHRELLAQSFRTLARPPPSSALAPPRSRAQVRPCRRDRGSPEAGDRPLAAPRSRVKPVPADAREGARNDVVCRPTTFLEAELAASGNVTFEDEETRVLRMPTDLAAHGKQKLGAPTAPAQALGEEDDTRPFATRTKRARLRPPARARRSNRRPQPASPRAIPNRAKRPRSRRRPGARMRRYRPRRAFRR